MSYKFIKSINSTSNAVVYTILHLRDEFSKLKWIVSHQIDKRLVLTHMNTALRIFTIYVGLPSLSIFVLDIIHPPLMYKYFPLYNCITNNTLTKTSLSQYLIYFIKTSSMIYIIIGLLN